MDTRRQASLPSSAAHSYGRRSPQNAISSPSASLLDTPYAVEDYRFLRSASPSSMDDTQSYSSTSRIGYPNALSEDQERVPRAVAPQQNRGAVRPRTPYYPTASVYPRDVGAGIARRSTVPDVGMPLSSTPRAYPPDAPLPAQYREPLIPSEGGSQGAAAFAFSPNSRWIAGGYKDGKIVLWRTAPFGVAAQHSERGRFAVRVLAFSPDGQQLASTDEDGRVMVWSIDQSGVGRESVTLRLVRCVLCSLHAQILAVSWHPGNTGIAMLSNEAVLYTLDLQQHNTMALPVYTFSGRPIGNPAQSSTDAILGALGHPGV